MSQNAAGIRTFKIIVIGDANVGKTTFTYRFCEGKYLELSEATIGVDFRSRTVNIDGEDVTLQLWDTAGQERYRMSMIRHYYRNAHAIIFMYDVTNAASFNNLKKWIEESNNNCLQDIPKILVGNKCDEVSVVPTHMAQKFSDQNNMPLFEASARLDSHNDIVASIFMTLAYKLKNHKHFIRAADTVIPTHSPNVEAEKQQRSKCC